MNQKVDSPGKIDMQDAWRSIRQFRAGSKQLLDLVFESALSKSDMSIQCSHRDKPPDTPTHVDVVKV